VRLPTRKEVITTIVVVFIAFAVLTDPSGSADVTGNVWDQIKRGWDALSTFFEGVLDS
jgi:hypothetical protein